MARYFVSYVVQGAKAHYFNRDEFDLETITDLFDIQWLEELIAGEEVVDQEEVVILHWQRFELKEEEYET